MKLIIIDFSDYPINFETEEFIRQLGDSVTVYTMRKDLYKSFWYYEYLKEFSTECFVNGQASADAVYVCRSNNLEHLKFKIPYFYNIYAGTWDHFLDFNYQKFNKHFSKIKGAGAVFVNDKKINEFSHWCGLNSYFINQPVNTPKNKLIRNRKFIIPKLHIGFLPSINRNRVKGNRNKIVEDMWASAKSNWVLHIPEGKELDISDKNVIKYKISQAGVYNPCEIYKNSHVLVNPEDLSRTLEPTFKSFTLEAMSTGCVGIESNQHDNNTDYMFDKFHYFKLDYIDSNTLLDMLRYVDKRRSKLSNMSAGGSQLVQKYYNVGKIVQQKIQIIKNNI